MERLISCQRTHRWKPGWSENGHRLLLLSLLFLNLFVPLLHYQSVESEIKLVISDSSMQCYTGNKRENGSLQRRNSQEMKGHT